MSTVKPNELQGEMYSGSGTEGNVAVIVPIGDDFLLRYNPMFSFDTKVFFKTK